MGEVDEKDQRMLYHVTNKTPAKEIEEDCELKGMEGILKDLSSHITTYEKQVILNNSVEILILDSEKKNLLRILHETHLETDAMKRLASGKFFWKNMSQDLEQTYTTCKECTEEGLSKVHKKWTATPEDLTMIAP